MRMFLVGLGLLIVSEAAICSGLCNLDDVAGLSDDVRRALSRTGVAPGARLNTQYVKSAQTDPEEVMRLQASGASPSRLNEARKRAYNSLRLHADQLANAGDFEGAIAHRTRAAGFMEDRANQAMTELKKQAQQRPLSVTPRSIEDVAEDFHSAQAEYLYAGRIQDAVNAAENRIDALARAQNRNAAKNPTEGERNAVRVGIIEQLQNQTIKTDNITDPIAKARALAAKVNLYEFTSEMASRELFSSGWQTVARQYRDRAASAKKELAEHLAQHAARFGVSR